MFTSSAAAGHGVWGDTSFPQSWVLVAGKLRTTAKVFLFWEALNNTVSECAAVLLSKGKRFIISNSSKLPNALKVKHLLRNDSPALPTLNSIDHKSYIGLKKLSFKGGKKWDSEMQLQPITLFPSHVLTLEQICICQRPGPLLALLNSQSARTAILNFEYWQDGPSEEDDLPDADMNLSVRERIAYHYIRLKRSELALKSFLRAWIISCRANGEVGIHEKSILSPSNEVTGVANLVHLVVVQQPFRILYRYCKRQRKTEYLSLDPSAGNVLYLLWLVNPAILTLLFTVFLSCDVMLPKFIELAAALANKMYALRGNAIRSDPETEDERRQRFRLALRNLRLDRV